MTEKRFILTESFNCLLNVTFICKDNINYMTVDETIDLLNSLLEENEQLKFKLGKLNILYKAKCKTEEQLLKMGKKVEKENEQLKSENNMLKVTIGRNEAYIKRLTQTSEWKTSAYDGDVE